MFPEDAVGAFRAAITMGYVQQQCKQRYKITQFRPHLIVASIDVRSIV
jgi:hypothetical protein